MFFHKAKNINSENNIEDNTPIINYNPVYVVGDNALAYFLATKFEKAGENVIVISNKSNNTSLNTNGLTFKEEISLQKSHLKFKTSFWIKDKPKLIILTSSNDKVKAAITSISSKKINNAPVLCFTPLKDINFLHPFLGENISRCFFDGYLSYSNQTLIQLGRTPSITICQNEHAAFLSEIKNIFATTEINLKFSSDSNSEFWNYFILYAAGSLLSTYFNKDIAVITKDKNLRDHIKPLVIELCSIAEKDKALVNADEILKKLYNTPNNYRHPLQEDFSLDKIGNLDSISSYFLDSAHQYKCPTTEITKILNKLFNIILA